MVADLKHCVHRGKRICDSTGYSIMSRKLKDLIVIISNIYIIDYPEKACYNSFELDSIDAFFSDQTVSKKRRPDKHRRAGYGVRRS